MHSEKNNHLKSLWWDQNNISIGGWQSLVNCLSQNRTLVHCPVPRNDMEKAVKDSKNKDVYAQRVKECMENLQAAVKQNLGGQGTSYTSEYEKSKRGRSYTVRPAYMTLKPGSIPPGTFSNTENGRASQFGNPMPVTRTSFIGSESSTATGFHTRSSFMAEIPSHNESFMDPPAPEEDYDYSAPPPTDGNENEGFGYDEPHSYENDYNQEYDDSTYESESAPAPPPPPPF